MSCPSCFSMRVYTPYGHGQLKGTDPWKVLPGDVECKKTTTEPYSPWQDAAKCEIKEHKKGVGRKLLLTNTPRKCCDNCLECEAV